MLLDRRQYDLLITDWNMPEMCGLDLVMEVRRTSPDSTNAGGQLPPTYVNKVTPWWDGSQLYGSTEERNREVPFTQREFDLLHFLASHPGRVFSREQLMDAVWKYSFYSDTSTVTVHVRRLRAKIEANPAQPRHIETVWGVGYRFTP